MAIDSNLLTVDLEEWFVVEALKEHCDRNQWSELPSTLEQNTVRMLQLFRRHDVRATFFVLGYCADRFPDLIAEIPGSGRVLEQLVGFEGTARDSDLVDEPVEGLPEDVRCAVVVCADDDIRGVPGGWARRGNARQQSGAAR